MQSAKFLNLKGKKVLVTCSAASAEDIIPALRNAGAQLTHIPLVETREPSDQCVALDSAIRQLELYQCAAFTSKNAVEAFFGRLFDCTIPESMRFAAVGPATARALARYGMSGVVVPGRNDAEGLLEVLAGFLKHGDRILWPRARQARTTLADGLRALGVIVDDIEAYQTAMPQEIDRARLLSIVDGMDVDVVLFDSPSAVSNFVEIVGKERAMRFAKVATLMPIGNITAASIKSALSPRLLVDS